MAATFDDYLGGISRLGGLVRIGSDTQASIAQFVAAIDALPAVTRDSLESILNGHPEWLPLLGACAGLTQEQLHNVLRHKVGTPSFNRVARSHAAQFVAVLDADYGLVAELDRDRSRQWSFTDILIERQASRLRASGSIERGRGLEDRVEAIVTALGLPFQMRGRFSGRGAATAPCDLAIPAAGAGALIVCAIKGFDSTGSKLTDAAREIVELATVRQPRQFVFAVVDGIGWLNRQADLRRIHALWESNQIDGLYTVSTLPDFTRALEAAALRLGLTGPFP